MKKLYVWASEYELMMGWGENPDEAKSKILSLKKKVNLNNTWNHRYDCYKTFESYEDITDDFSSEIENDVEYNDVLDALNKEPWIFEDEAALISHANE